jgi:hypothetical protein
MALSLIFSLVLTASYAETGKTEAGLCCTPAASVSIPLEDQIGFCPKDSEEVNVKDKWGKFTSMLSQKKPWETLQDEWLTYNQKMKDVVKKNAKTVNQAAFKDDPLDFLYGLEKLKPFIEAMDDLDKRGYLRELLKMPGFKKASTNEGFLELLRDHDVNKPSAEVARFLNKPHFRESFLKIQEVLKSNEGYEYIKLMIENDLSVYDAKSRSEATQLRNFMNSQGITAEKIEKWKQEKDPAKLPRIKDIPYPRNLFGKIIDRYKNSVQGEVETHLTKNKPPAPVNKDKLSFDEWISPLHDKSIDTEITVNGKKHRVDQKKMEAIDAVARTLWGEALSCQNNGLPQFEAIGRVIADRSLAVQAAMAEQKNNNKIQNELDDQFARDVFGRGETAINKYMQASPSNKKQGLSDFGRKENLDMHPAAQVVTKRLQFSVWNSYLLERPPVNLDGLNPGRGSNIPNVNISIQKPQTAGDDHALINVVCPSKKPNALWKHAVNLASQIVLDPVAYQKKYKFESPEKEILFYTHEAELPFAKEVIVENFIIDGKKVPLRGKGKGPCDNFRLFVPKTGGRY